jgi:hypothetical protein
MAPQTIRLSSKGSGGYPKSLRTAHRWNPGTEFIIEQRPDGILLRPKQKTCKASMGRPDATRLSHLDDAIKAVDLVLTPEERTALEAPYQPRAIAGHIQPSAARMLKSQ